MALTTEQIAKRQFSLGASDMAAIDRRFSGKVRVTPGCWWWTAGIAPNGYGVFWAHGRNISAHRYSYERLVGPIPPKFHIDHLCRNKVCVNPAHLEAVTPRTNTLRGISGVAENAVKTACPVGHLYDEENTYVHRGKRNCRECGRQRVRKWRAGGSKRSTASAA